MATRTAPQPAGRTGEELIVVDMLRGFAALGIALFHARVGWWVGWREISGHPDEYSWFDRATAWLALPSPVLGSCVMLFFVLSGFCVHQPVSGTRPPVNWPRFWARRFLRIYPPYLVAAALSLGATAVYFPDLFPGRAQVIATLFMGQNYVGAAVDSVAGSQPAANPALWSLPVEMELYLVYPAVWLLARAAGWTVALGAVAAVSALALVAYRAGWQFLEGNFALYWIIWCGGAWLREQQMQRRLDRVPPAIWIGGLLAGAAAAGLTFKGVTWLSNFCWGFFYFSLLWVGLASGLRRPTGPVGVVIATLSAWSYSFYLLHFPLLFILAAWWAVNVGAKPTNYLMSWVACAAILPAVWVFHRCVERPSHGWARRFAFKPPANA